MNVKLRTFFIEIITPYRFSADLFEIANAADDRTAEVSERIQMNLRKKISAIMQIGTIVSMVVFVSEVFAGATKTSSNSISFPVALSLPLESSAVHEAVIRFGGARFLNGFDVSQKLEDVTIHDPFAIQLKGVSFKSHVQGRLDRDSTGLIAEASLQNPAIAIDSISIHSVVSARVAGVDARIRIDADCKASTIFWSDQSLAFFARAKLQSQPRLAIVVSSLALPAVIPKPEMKLSCTGPVGIEEMIRNYAWTALQQRWGEDSFARQLESKMQLFFADAMKIGGAGLNLANQPNLKMILRPTSYHVTAGGAHLLAMLDVKLDRPVSMLVASGDDIVLPTGAIDSLILTVPATTAQTLMQAMFAPSVWSEWLEAQAIQGFRDLMSSRFKQFFAFPDLANYDKNAPFWFVMGMSTAPTLKCAKNGLNISAPVSARMLLQDSKFDIGYKSMVLFQLPTQLLVSFPRATSTIPTAVTIQSMDMLAEFDARYIETEGPNTSIATESILPDVKDYIENETKDLTALGGALGESFRLLNQTDLSCDVSDQMLRLRL